MFEVDEMKDLCKEFLPNLMSTLIVRIGSTNGIEKSNSFNRVLVEYTICNLPLFIYLFIWQIKNKNKNKNKTYITKNRKRRKKIWNLNEKSSKRRKKRQMSL